jgi:hypothetical protein
MCLEMLFGRFTNRNHAEFLWPFSMIMSCFQTGKRTHITLMCSDLVTRRKAQFLKLNGLKHSCHEPIMIHIFENCIHHASMSTEECVEDGMQWTSEPIVFKPLNPLCLIHMHHDSLVKRRLLQLFSSSWSEKTNVKVRKICMHRIIHSRKLCL